MLYNFFTKVAVYFNNFFSQALFYRSKKYILSWGLHSYGQPKIVCYDDVSRLTVGDYVSIADRVSFLLGANHKRGLMVNYPRSKINSKVTQSETNERGDILAWQILTLLHLTSLKNFCRSIDMYNWYEKN